MTKKWYCVLCETQAHVGGYYYVKAFSVDEAKRDYRNVLEVIEVKSEIGLIMARALGKEN